MSLVSSSVQRSRVESTPDCSQYEPSNDLSLGLITAGLTRGNDVLRHSLGLQCNGGALQIDALHRRPVGPEADSPAFDYSTYWARTGFMDLLHEPEAPPAFQRPGIGDHSAALSMVSGILAALRMRDASGEGQEVSVKVLSVDEAAQKMSLSIKAVQAPPPEEEKAADTATPADESAAARPTPPRSSKPLKGGLNKPTGGEDVGLRW